MARDADLMAELERIDRFCESGEGGEVPLDVLRASGLDLPEDDSALDDAALHTRLWELIAAMAGIGIVLDSTDHLSDRALYHYLVTDGLKEEVLLTDDPDSVWHLSPIGGGSEEDCEIYLRYYADDEYRQESSAEFGRTLPPKEMLPYDRDRLLPGAHGEGEGVQ